MFVVVPLRLKGGYAGISLVEERAFSNFFCYMAWGITGILKTRVVLQIYCGIWLSFGLPPGCTDLTVSRVYVLDLSREWDTFLYFIFLLRFGSLIWPLVFFFKSLASMGCLHLKQGFSIYLRWGQLRPSVSFFTRTKKKNRVLSLKEWLFMTKTKDNIWNYSTAVQTCMLCNYIEFDTRKEL